MKEKLDVVLRPVASLKPNPKNAKQHSDAQIKKIARIIKEVGWTKPIVIDEKGMILAGHGARLAAKLLGLEAVPCVVKAGLSPEQKRAYALADNRVAEDSTWNIGVVADELAALTAVGFDLSLTGFEDDEIGERALGKASGVTEIETHELNDRFWISIRGPLKQQAKVLQALRKSTAGIDDVQVELGTTDGFFRSASRRRDRLGRMERVQPGRILRRGENRRLRVRAIHRGLPAVSHRDPARGGR